MIGEGDSFGLGRGAVASGELSGIAGAAGVPPVALIEQAQITSCLQPVVCARSPRCVIPMGKFELKSNVQS